MVGQVGNVDPRTAGSGEIDPAKITTVAELAAQLRRLRLRAGNPALREIERRAQQRGRQLPRSTLATVLAGDRPPRREVLLALIRVLGAPDAEIPGWVAAWERIIDRRDDMVDASTDRLDPDVARTRIVGYPLNEDSTRDSVWRFSRDYPVTLVCSGLPPSIQGRVPYTDPTDPDYSELLTYGDPDALLHLYGHVRAMNPQLEVRFSTTKGLRADDYETHLAIIGGTDLNSLTRHMLSSLPIQMRSRPTTESEWAGFAVTTADEDLRFSPTFDDVDGEQVLREDVLLFFRGPNPFNAKCTVTICAGGYARGTLAAVRSFTDPILGQVNESYVRSRFGDRTHFGFIARAVIVNGVVIPPDLSVPVNRLYEWTVSG
ncbi:MAG TPA: helix-turn-helix transcriptional regulator [Pseudonocardiaceae bacterium]|nr:helix-turn-helix transcriptional regulator [Pseudonocardiaceae bacterium]